jgi:hypothetical protein
MTKKDESISLFDEENDSDNKVWLLNVKAQLEKERDAVDYVDAFTMWFTSSPYASFVHGILVLLFLLSWLSIIMGWHPFIPASTYMK